MTKKDFFVLLLKLFGLYSLTVALFSTLPNTFAYVITDLTIYSILWMIFVILIVIGLFVILIFKAEIIVSILNLEKGFDEERIEGQFQAIDIIKIGTFIIGGLMIVNNIPFFLAQTHFIVKSEIFGTANRIQPYTQQELIISGVKILVGFLLVSNFKLIAKIFKQ